MSRAEKKSEEKRVVTSDVMKLLRRLVYQVEYSPNCPARYLVRVVTPGTGGLDKLHPSETKDTFAYGETEEEAAAKVLQTLERIRAFQKGERKLKKILRIA